MSLYRFVCWNETEWHRTTNRSQNSSSFVVGPTQKTDDRPMVNKSDEVKPDIIVLYRVSAYGKWRQTLADLFVWARSNRNAKRLSVWLPQSVLAGAKWREGTTNVRKMRTETCVTRGTTSWCRTGQSKVPPTVKGIQKLKHKHCHILKWLQILHRCEKKRLSFLGWKEDAEIHSSVSTQLFNMISLALCWWLCHLIFPVHIMTKKFGVTEIGQMTLNKD